MIPLVIYFISWVGVFLLHISLQPHYLRHTPLRFSGLSASHHRFLRTFLPIFVALASILTQGIGGIFTWGFIAPLSGIFTALLCCCTQKKPLSKPAPPVR